MNIEPCSKKGDEGDKENPLNSKDDIQSSEECGNPQLPLQANQNSVKSIQVSTPLNYLHKNYMFQSVLFKTQLNRNDYIFQEIIHGMKSKPINYCANENNKPMPSNRSEKKIRDYEYEFKYVAGLRDSHDINTNCEWLDFRLQVQTVLSMSNVCLSELLVELRSCFLHVVIDLMIHYHTNSDFALQLFKIEGLNLLLIIKHPILSSVLEDLPLEFRKYLLEIIENSENFEVNAHFADLPIPTLAENIMNNYVLINPKNQSLKYCQNHIPRVIYYSFFIPATVVTDGQTLNSIFHRKIISLQRKYKCKIILNGPFLRNLSPSSRNEFYHVEIFFEYMINYWIIVLDEFISWLNSFPRSTVLCQIDKICVSYVTNKFFCCDEIKNLMKRQHILREVDKDFVKLVKWVKLHQIDRAAF